MPGQGDPAIDRPWPRSSSLDSLALPPGAWARTHRRRLRHDGRTVLALTQGAFRPYVFPLMTPAGFAVTAEAPADHPHHASLWLGADHVHALTPTAPGRSRSTPTISTPTRPSRAGRPGG
ncbi:MAG: DUF6807 family protein [Geminicoccaceae bacterium]